MRAVEDILKSIGLPWNPFNLCLDQRNESIACRPCSLNFVDKSLREVLDLVQHIFYVCHFLFAFYHEILILVRFRHSKRENTSKSSIFEMFPSRKILSSKPRGEADCNNFIHFNSVSSLLMVFVLAPARSVGI